MEMREEDQPPEHIWLDSEALDGHFEWVKQKYASKGAGSDSESVPDPDDYDQNELTRGLRG